MQKINLTNLGLTDGEAKVYLSLTELGSTTVGPIVKKANVAYSNVYDILHRLMEKGIVTYIIKSKTKYFQAVSPKNLFVYLEKKEKELQTQKEALQFILPQLENLQKEKQSQEAEIFIGTKGLRSAYEKLFSNMKKNDEELFFYIHEKEFGEESDRFYASIEYLLKKVKTRGICNKEYKSSPFIKKAKYLNIKFVDFPIPGHMEVCNNFLLLVSWQKPIVAILITSESLSSHFRNYFNSVWKIAEK